MTKASHLPSGDWCVRAYLLELAPASAPPPPLARFFHIGGRDRVRSRDAGPALVVGAKQNGLGRVVDLDPIERQPLGIARLLGGLATTLPPDARDRKPGSSRPVSASTSRNCLLSSGKFTRYQNRRLSGNQCGSTRTRSTLSARQLGQPGRALVIGLRALRKTCDAHEMDEEIFQRRISEWCESWWYGVTTEDGGVEYREAGVTLLSGAGANQSRVLLHIASDRT